jgi:hypothetical protein
MKKLLFLCMLMSIAGYSQQFRYLDKNEVRARINTANDKFWVTTGFSAGQLAYEVPAGKGAHAMFANSIWIGGLDQGGQLHLAANTYRQKGKDFWAGPLDTTNIASFSSTATAVYNRVWKVDCNDINNFAHAYSEGWVAANTYTPAADLLAYPGTGSNHFQNKLSPYKDVNGNGIYDPLTGGDYPLIRGHQQVLSIFNDQYATHGESGAPAMGLEIHEQSYAYTDSLIVDSMQAINYTTFYRYTIYNRSNVSYHHVYITDWDDVDVGYYANDYIGTDTINSFGYCYNATATDPTALGNIGYGNKPPVCSHALLPINSDSDGIDNNQNGQIDEPGEIFKMNAVTYYVNNVNSNPLTMTNPNTAYDYYNYMVGLWKDNSPFTFGGNGYGGTVQTPYVFSGNPETNTGWTEASAGIQGGDRRLLMSSGPFNFPANSKIEWGYAIVFSQDTSQAVNTITQFGRRVQRDVRNIKYYEQMHQSPQCAPGIYSTSGIAENLLNFNALIYPNPAKERLTIDLNRNVDAAEITVYDIVGNKITTAAISNGYRGELDVKALSPGVYFAEIKSGGKKQVVKFIKE